MVCYEFEENKDNIFNPYHKYKILLNGYIENNKYKDNTLIEKEFILYLESHSVKYQLNINIYIKNIIISDIQITIDKVKEYNIENYDVGLVSQYYYLLKTPEELRYIKIKKIDSYFKDTILKNIENEDLESYCIYSPNYLILLEDVKQSKHGLICKNINNNINNIDFAQKILTNENYENYIKRFYKF